MKITHKDSKNTNWATCPEFMGTAKIVDQTELKEYQSQFGDREAFRYILEIPQKKENGEYWTVATKPLTPSLHEKSNLRKITEKVLGRELSTSELGDWDTESLVGKYCSISVEHNVSGDTTFANVAHIGKVKGEETWKSTHVRLKDRGMKPVQKTVEPAKSPTAEKAMNSMKPAEIEAAFDGVFGIKPVRSETIGFR